MMTANTLITLGYQGFFLKRKMNGSAKPMMINCPISMPILKANSEEINLSAGIAISLSSPAKPMP